MNSTVGCFTCCTKDLKSAKLITLIAWIIRRLPSLLRFLIFSNVGPILEEDLNSSAQLLAVPVTECVVNNGGYNYFKFGGG